MEAAIFDYDGTLVHLNINFGVIRAKIEELITHCGIDPYPLKGLYILEMIGEATKQISDNDDSRSQAFYEQTMELVAEHEVGAATKGRILPGVMDVLRMLKQRGIKVGIITRNCDRAVRITFPNIERVCDTFVPRDLVSRVKPHPNHLALALLRMNVRHRHQCLMVGDHVLDIEAGKRMGMKTAGVLTGNTTREQFMEAGADFIVTDVTQIPACIFAEQES